MSGQSAEITDLFHEWMLLVSTLSQANAEHLRILQLRSGFDILLMKNSDATDVIDSQRESEVNLGASQARIEKLENAVAELDAKIEAATKLEEE
ncbi:hypothetical protein [Ruegeria hyattellae]|uniref:hypothetical protein n=1 Tax=Ruegeria hyattellae TaxID=3233337 RepID=UPI00355B73CB